MALLALGKQYWPTAGGRMKGWESGELEIDLSGDAVESAGVESAGVDSVGGAVEAFGVVVGVGLGIEEGVEGFLDGVADALVEVFLQLSLVNVNDLGNGSSMGLIDSGSVSMVVS